MFRQKMFQNLSLLSCLCFIAFPCAGFAMQATVKPSLSVSAKHDNNFFKVEKKERDVFSYLVEPGIELGLETAKTKASLNYKLDARYFDDEGSIPAGERDANDDDFLGHDLIAEINMIPLERLKIGLEDSFYKTIDPARSDTLYNSVLREKYYINRFTPSIFFEAVYNFTFWGRYRYTILDYYSSRNEDSKEDRGIVDIIYNFNSKTCLDLEYQYWITTYDIATSDYNSSQTMVVFRQQFNYLEYELGAGYQDRRFDDKGRKDMHTFAYRAVLKFQNPPKGQGDAKSYATLSAEQNFNNVGLDADYFTGHLFSMGLGHVFMKKIGLDIKFSYLESNYEIYKGLTHKGTIEARDDNTYKVTGKINYAFLKGIIKPFFTAGYEERDSNLAGFEYENTFFMLGLDLSYDLL